MARFRSNARFMLGSTVIVAAAYVFVAQLVFAPADPPGTVRYPLVSPQPPTPTRITAPLSPLRLHEVETEAVDQGVEAQLAAWSDEDAAASWRRLQERKAAMAATSQPAAEVAPPLAATSQASAP